MTMRASSLVAAMVRLGTGTVLAAGAVTACSSSGSTHTAGGSAPGSSPPATISPAPSSKPPTSSTSATPADPATTKAITTAYQEFFGSSSTQAQSEDALQHGASFHQTLVDQGKVSYSQHSGAKVSAVSVRGPVANVTFTITSNGTPLLSNVRGFAVQEDGRWKVAATTFCTLLKLEGHPPAACSDASITALPE